tara:strand:+ start:916 stop:1242 length:327 start_codon:yes stop_codon:yes gene_type:complete
MKTKLIIVIVLGILFIVASVFSIVNASRLLSEGFKEMLDFDECDYRQNPREVLDNLEEPADAEVIAKDKDFYCVNNKKRNIAESLAYLIISLPLTIFFYRKLIKFKND